MHSARSGRQNIAEGSRAAATSSQAERRLVHVARSSLEERLLDYEDFLRHRRLPRWHPESAEAMAVREIGRRSPKDDPSDRSDPSDQRKPLAPDERAGIIVPEGIIFPFVRRRDRGARSPYSVGRRSHS